MRLLQVRCQCQDIKVCTGVLAWLLFNIGIVVFNSNCRYPITNEWPADSIAFMPSNVACAMGLVSGSFAIIISFMVGTPVDPRKQRKCWSQLHVDTLETNGASIVALPRYIHHMSEGSC